MQVIRKGFILDNRKFYKHIHLVRISWSDYNNCFELYRVFFPCVPDSSVTILLRLTFSYCTALNISFEMMDKWLSYSVLYNGFECVLYRKSGKLFYRRADFIIYVRFLNGILLWATWYSQVECWVYERWGAYEK